MFKKKDKQSDRLKLKKENLKDTIKLSDSCYIKVTKEGNTATVCKVDLVKGILTDEYKEYITRLVPENEIDQKEILKSLSEISEKLNKETSDLQFTTVELKGKYCTNDLEEVKKSVDNMTETIREEILRAKKLDNYSNLINSKFFLDVKTWSTFKDLDEIELAELLINLKKVYLFYGGNI